VHRFGSLVSSCFRPECCRPCSCRPSPACTSTRVTSTGKRHWIPCGSPSSSAATIHECRLVTQSNGSRRRQSRSMQSNVFQLASSLAALALGACSAGPAQARPPSGDYHPPPLPGFSITHTKLCGCTVCSPASCCGGGGDEEASCSDTDAGTVCGLAVVSCTPRCGRFSWRVRTSMDCDAKRPPSCCPES